MGPVTTSMALRTWLPGPGRQPPAALTPWSVLLVAAPGVPFSAEGALSLAVREPGAAAGRWVASGGGAGWAVPAADGRNELRGASRKSPLGVCRSIPAPAALAAGLAWLSSWPGKLPRSTSLAPLPRGGLAAGPWQAAVLNQLPLLPLQPLRPLRRCCETEGVTPPRPHPLTDCTPLPSPPAEGSHRHHPPGRRLGRPHPRRQCATGTETPSPLSEHSWVSGALGANPCCWEGAGAGRGFLMQSQSLQLCSSRAAHPALPLLPVPCR